MIVHTKNVPLKKISRKELKAAAIDMSRFLWDNSRLQSRSLDNINLMIQFNAMADCHATCEWWGDSSRRPMDFIITIDPSQSKREILCSLAHELVHMKQYRVGQLHELDRGQSQVRWLKKLINIDNIDYYFLPWEIEARGLESVLYDLYKNKKVKK